MSVQKTVFGLLDRYFPSFTAKQVYQFMSNPQVHKLREFEKEALSTAKKEIIRYKNFDIQTYTWGNPNDKTLFFVHGWEGQAGNFGALIDIILNKGYYIVAFDAPSHGSSSKGSTNMFEFAELVSILFKKYQPKAVISHSFGSVTSMLAMSENPEIAIDQWILVTTPHNFKDRLQDTANKAGVTDRTINKLIHILETKSNFRLEDMNMDYYGSKIDHVKEAIIVHSRADKILPIISARQTNQSIPQSRLIELDNLGHYKILWSEELKEIVAEQLN